MTPTDMREALQLCIDAMLHDGVPTDPYHPRRVALTAAEAALACRHDAELAMIREQAAAETDDWAERQTKEPTKEECDAMFVRKVLALSRPDAQADELKRLREIARLIGSIFVHGNFKAETYNERALEKLLREQGCFFESLADYDAARAAAPQEAHGVPLTVEIRAIVMANAPEACQVWLRHSNGQQFAVGNPHETWADGEWFADQLRKALSAPSPDREQVGLIDAAVTKLTADFARVGESFMDLCSELGCPDNTNMLDWARGRMTCDACYGTGRAAWEYSFIHSSATGRGDSKVGPCLAYDREIAYGVGCIDQREVTVSHSVEQPSERREQDCPHGVEDGACKQCYGEATSGEQVAATFPRGFKVEHIEGHGWIIDPPSGAPWVAYEGSPAGELMQALAASASTVGETAPVAIVESWTNGSYHRNYKLKWLQDVAAGTKLYADQRQTASAPTLGDSEALRDAAMRTVQAMGYEYAGGERWRPSFSFGERRDDVAVDAFARAMKVKMADAHAKGRSGWEDMNPSDLSRMLREHVEKGDPRDVANFCMMLWHHSAQIAPQPQASEPKGLTPEWLWSEFMDYCKAQGRAPSECKRLFEIVTRARALLEAKGG